MKFFVLSLVVLLGACASDEPRKCPMGAMAHIEAPRRLAMQTAFATTAKYGYTDFTILREEDSGENFKMLIKMSDDQK
jgi:hypothetical protein